MVLVVITVIAQQKVSMPTFPAVKKFPSNNLIFGFPSFIL